MQTTFGFRYSMWQQNVLSIVGFISNVIFSPHWSIWLSISCRKDKIILNIILLVAEDRNKRYIGSKYSSEYLVSQITSEQVHQGCAIPSKTWSLHSQPIMWPETLGHSQSETVTYVAMTTVILRSRVRMIHVRVTSFMTCHDDTSHSDRRPLGSYEWRTRWTGSVFILTLFKKQLWRSRPWRMEWIFNSASGPLSHVLPFFSHKLCFSSVLFCLGAFENKKCIKNEKMLDLL